MKWGNKYPTMTTLDQITTKRNSLIDPLANFQLNKFHIITW